MTSVVLSQPVGMILFLDPKYGAVHRRNAMTSVKFFGFRPVLGSFLVSLAFLGGCATSQVPVEISIFSLNDFHGHIQPKSPVPLMPKLPDAKTGEIKAQPAGGAAYVASVLSDLSSKRQNFAFVGAGDLIGASPQFSSLLKDEPTLTALSNMGMVATALGNHDMDAGLTELLRKSRGECPPEGCAWPEFKGAAFPYLAVNMLDAETGKTVLPTHIIKEIGGLKVAFVGAVTRDTPKVIVAKSIRGLKFTDEVDAFNALIPKLRAEGAQLLVAMMHEGAMHDGGANDPTYECPGLRGRGVDIAKRLDPAYGIIISGHTHQAYTCKINGRLLVQAGSFGGWITESRLKVSANGAVLDAQAVNYPVLQSVNKPNPAFVALVQRASELTNAIRTQPIAVLASGASRSVALPHGDSTMGNLIADAQLAFAKKRGEADIAMINSGGIRADLTIEAGKPVTMSDLFAVQPFGNEMIVMSLTGAQLREGMRKQLPQTNVQRRFTQVSNSMRMVWSQTADGASILKSVTVNGHPLQDDKIYRVVVNNFMAEGGDDLSVFRQGTERNNLGPDIDALVEWLRDNPEAVKQIQPGRILRQEG
jgi:5'-nucleotidase